MKLTFSNLLLFFTETQLLENNRLAILQAFFISVNMLLDLDSNHHCSVFQRRRKFSRKLKLKGGIGKIEPFSEVYWIRTPKSISLKAATPATPEILWQEKNGWYCASINGKWNQDAEYKLPIKQKPFPSSDLPYILKFWHRQPQIQGVPTSYRWGAF